MERERKYEMQYAVPQQDGSNLIKTIRFTGEAKKKQNLEACKRQGYHVMSVKTLYPFSTAKNQHNFDLIHSLCFNLMSEMERGEREMNIEQYEGLEEMIQLADKYMCLELPVAWLPWEDYSKAKELAMMAVSHREQRCIEAGRTDLLRYC